MCPNSSPPTKSTSNSSAFFLTIWPTLDPHTDTFILRLHMMEDTLPTHLASTLPLAKFVALLCLASDAESRKKFQYVMGQFINFTGEKFQETMLINCTHSASKKDEYQNKHFPCTLRTGLRGFLCSLLHGLYGKLFDGSDAAIAVRAMVDKYMDFATYDTRSRNKSRADVPEGAGPGLCKVVDMVVHLFPVDLLFESDLPFEEPGDPVEATPVTWDPDATQTFLAFCTEFLEPQHATGKRRFPSSTTAFAMGPEELELFSDGIRQLLEAKGNWCRFTTITPPCPHGRRVLMHPHVAGILFQTHSGGRKKTSDVENPFGTAKGYSYDQRVKKSLMGKKRRHEQRAAEAAPPPPQVDLIARTAAMWKTGGVVPAVEVAVHGMAVDGDKTGGVQKRARQEPEPEAEAELEPGSDPNIFKSILDLLKKGVLEAP